jgi:putative transposase
MSQDSQPFFPLDEDNDPTEIQRTSENAAKSHRLPSDELITPEVRLRMEIIQSLTEPCDRKTYGIRKREAAKKADASESGVSQGERESQATWSKA